MMTYFQFKVSFTRFNSFAHNSILLHPIELSNIQPNSTASS